MRTALVRTTQEIIRKKKIAILTSWYHEFWAPSQYPKRRLIVRSREVSRPRDWYFKLSNRFEIWQAHRQQCCRSACQISERSNNSKYKSRGFETSRDHTIRRLFGYWDGVLNADNVWEFSLLYVLFSNFFLRWQENQNIGIDHMIKHHGSGLVMGWLINRGPLCELVVFTRLLTTKTNMLLLYSVCYPSPILNC